MAISEFNYSSGLVENIQSIYRLRKMKSSFSKMSLLHKVLYLDHINRYGITKDSIYLLKDEEPLLVIFYALYAEIDIDQIIQTKSGKLRLIRDYDKTIDELETIIYNAVTKHGMIDQDVYKTFFDMVSNDVVDFMKTVINMPGSNDLFKITRGLLNSDRVSNDIKVKLVEEVISKDVAFSSFPFDTLKDEFVWKNVSVFLSIPIEQIQDIFDFEKKIPNCTGETLFKYQKACVDLLLTGKYTSVDEMRRVVLKLEALRSEKTERLFEYLDNDIVYKVMKENVQVPKDLNQSIYESILEGKMLPEFKDFYSMFGTSKVMQEHFDELLNLFIGGSLDEEFRRYLAISLLAGYHELEKNRMGLESKIVFTTYRSVNETLGSYTSTDKEVYFNKYNVFENQNLDEAFAKGITTINHELTHAKQYQIDTKRDVTDYKVILQCMDNCMEFLLGSQYYSENYWGFSAEVAARNESFVKSMMFFERYPEYQKHVLNGFESEVLFMQDRFRKVRLNDKGKNYTTVVAAFIESVNDYMSICQQQGNDPHKFFENILKEFPSLGNVIVFNKNTNRIQLLSEDLLDILIENLKKGGVSPEILTEINCYENLKYDGKIIKELQKMKRLDGSDIDLSKMQQIENDIIASIGVPPRR